MNRMSGIGVPNAVMRCCGHFYLGRDGAPGIDVDVGIDLDGGDTVPGLGGRLW